MKTLGRYTATITTILNTVMCDIESSNLYYADFGKGDGLQCNHNGGDETYEIILNKSRQISQLFKEIYELNETITDTLQVHDKGTSPTMGSDNRG